MTTPPQSGVRRTTPLVMLIRLEPESLPVKLQFDLFSMRVVWVRHPLPACQRMLVLRPMVILVGEHVRAPDVELVVKHARHIEAEVLQLSPLVARGQFGEWLERACARVAEMRFRGVREQVG